MREVAVDPAAVESAERALLGAHRASLVARMRSFMDGVARWPS